MKARILALSTLFLLSGCFDDVTDVQSSIDTIKANTRQRVDPVPNIKEFQHIPYTAGDLRSPFAVSIPEALQDRFLQRQDCLNPEPERQKEALEKFALDNLKMRGTLGDATTLWGLVEATDGALYRVTVNNYMGLFHGKIIKVEPSYIELLELIPDGSGCWMERNIRLQLLDAAPAVN